MATITKEQDGTFTARLTEEELDALRVPLGRISGPRNWMRTHTSNFYFAANDALGYKDDLRAASGYVASTEATKTPTTDRN